MLYLDLKIVYFYHFRLQITPVITLVINKLVLYPDTFLFQFANSNNNKTKLVIF